MAIQPILAFGSLRAGVCLIDDAAVIQVVWSIRGIAIRINDVAGLDYGRDIAYRRCDDGAGVVAPGIIKGVIACAIVIPVAIVNIQGWNGNPYAQPGVAVMAARACRCGCRDTGKAYKSDCYK